MELLLMLAKTGSSDCGAAKFFGIGLYDNLCSGGQVKLDDVADVFVLVANLVRLLTAAAGALAVICIMVGGVWYITSHGDPARLKQAKEILNYSVIGLVVVLLAYAIVTFIANGF